MVQLALRHRRDKWGLPYCCTCEEVMILDEADTNPVGGSSSKRNVRGDNLFMPSDENILTAEKLSPHHTQAAIIKPSEGLPKYHQTHQEENGMMKDFNRLDPTSDDKRTKFKLSKEASELLDDDEMIERAVLLNLRSLIDIPGTDTSDSSVYLNCYSSVTMDSIGNSYDSFSALDSPSKVPETLQITEMRDQVLLDIAKTLISKDKSVVDLFGSSSVSLNTFSSEYRSLLSMKESDDMNGMPKVVPEKPHDAIAMKDQDPLNISKTTKSNSVKSREDITTQTTVSLNTFSSEYHSILSMKDSSDVHGPSKIVPEKLNHDSKSLVDLVAHSSISVSVSLDKSYSSEYQSILSMEESDGNVGLEGRHEEEIEEEMLALDPANWIGQSCTFIDTTEDEEVNSLMLPDEHDNYLMLPDDKINSLQMPDLGTTRMIEAHGHDGSVEKMLHDMKETYVSKLNTALYKMNTSKISRGLELNISKDDDNTLVTAPTLATTTIDESFNGYFSSCESIPRLPASADSDASVNFEQLTETEYECEFHIISTSEDESPTVLSTDDFFERLQTNRERISQRKKELNDDIHRRIEVLKNDSSSRASPDTEFSALMSGHTAQTGHEHGHERELQVVSSPENRKSLSKPREFARTEVLYEYGKRLVKRKKELDIHRRIREIKNTFTIEMQWRYKKTVEQPRMKPIRGDDLYRRLYTKRALEMNEVGKKLRSAISKRSILRKKERENGFHV